ncbi:expressed protein [Phakopsora pachyrhizi]|uniref:Expressed protein n=1 Tax=Phakopsora pachyrhizi TaxID=170000 RepID=A0AAV0BTE8_PHAPC|nr:expressed protein [Phakopsora pachyrhizi]
MISLRNQLIFCLNPTMILMVRAVKGFFPMESVGEEGKYLSLDSASKISNGISNLQQNIQDDKQNYLATTTYPSNRYSLKQMAKEHHNWEEEDISLIHEWSIPSSPPESVFLIEKPHEIPHGESALPHSAYMNHETLIDQPSNFQEELNFYLEDPRNSEPAEDLTDPFHWKETYPDEGSFKDQASSSNTIQHKFYGDLHDGNHINSVPHFDKFWSPSPFFLPLENPYLQITHNEPMPENPAFHFTQNDLGNSPPLSEMRNRVNQNQDLEDLIINPASSKPNYGSINTYPDKYIDNDHLITGNKKSRKALKRKAKLELTDDYSITGNKKKLKAPKRKSKLELTEEISKEREDLINVIRSHFSTHSSKTKQYFSVERDHGFMSIKNLKKTPEMEAKYKNYFDRKAFNFINGNGPRKGEKTNTGAKNPFENSDSSDYSKMKTYKITKYILENESDDFNLLRSATNQLAYSHVADALPRYIENISIIGIHIMKIISKKYRKNPVSEKFGNDQSLIEYTKRFWEFCFDDNGVTEGGLKLFFKSIKDGNSEDDINRFLSMGFTKSRNIPAKIFLEISSKIKKNPDRERIYMFAWYFTFFRTEVYYPELVLKANYKPGNYLKQFIEGGILHIIQNQN